MATILLIEDDGATRQMLRLCLVEAGHEVLEARHGKEGMTIALSEPLDLVVTDLVMPEKDGLEVLIEMREKLPQVPAIAITGGMHSSARELLLTAGLLGAVRTLIKPFALEDFQKAVAAVLDPAA